MSIHLSAAQSEQFDSEVHQQFQTAGNLRGSVTQRNNVVGGVYHFRRKGKGVAQQKSPQDDVVPMNVDHVKIPTTLLDWHASEYTDLFSAQEVNFDERAELASVIAGALGRRYDQNILDVMQAGTPTEADVDSTTVFTLSDLVDVSKALNEQGVGPEKRHIATSPQGVADLLKDTSVGSADYNSIRALVNGELNSFMGFFFHMVETRVEGGLDVTTGTVTGFAWHEDAIGIAVGIDHSTEVNYVPVKTSWLATGKYKGAAAVRDNGGYVKFTHDA